MEACYIPALSLRTVCVMTGATPVGSRQQRTDNLRETSYRNLHWPIDVFYGPLATRSCSNCCVCVSAKFRVAEESSVTR